MAMIWLTSCLFYNSLSHFNERFQTSIKLHPLEMFQSDVFGIYYFLLTIRKTLTKKHPDNFLNVIWNILGHIHLCPSFAK